MRYQMTNASPSQPVPTYQKMKNIQQQEDIVHGYNQAEASPYQPATVREGKANREKQAMRKPIILTLAISSILMVGCSSVQETGKTASGESMQRFVDVTRASGIVTEGAKSAGWADYDGDGCTDLLITQKAGPLLLKGNCSGQFDDVTAAAGINGPAESLGIAWADYDGDGDLDAYITSPGAANSLYRNNGNGSFSNVAELAGVDDDRSSVTATWGDMDGDGDLDLFVANRFYPRYDSDITDRLYRNDGNGRFTDVGITSGAAKKDRKTFAAAWLDYDNNGTLDLYLAVDFGDDQLLSNDGTGRFQNVSRQAGIKGPEHAMGLAVGDINNDGCPDVVSSNNTRGEPGDLEHGPTILYVNDCQGGFKDQTRAWGIEDRGTVDWGVNLVDWDNDGDQDLSIVSGGMMKDGEKESNVLYENRDGRLLDVTRPLDAMVTGAAFGSAWADYDNDGDLDWLIVNSTKNTVLLENRAAAGNYLKVRLKGKGGNRYAVGARLTLTAKGGDQTRVIQAGTSYGNSEELLAHFGLGTDTQVERLQITWPSGRQTTVTGLTVNQELILPQH
jgi:hypothetical protein